MKWKWITGLALAVVLLAKSPSLAAPTGGTVGGTGAGAAPVPEISPGSMAGALTLLTGGVLLVSSRRRKA
jgi:hypothetical protein